MNYNNEQFFSEVPQLHAQSSTFDRSHTHKMTMNVDYFYPIFIDELLPGDTAKLDFQVFGRLINPTVVPIMDEIYFETLWFKCPWRLLWNNTFKFFGERENPDDSNDFVLPTITVPTAQYNSIFDHFGLNPLSDDKTYVSLPLRMYNLVYNNWLRNQNLISSVSVPLDDEDDYTYYSLLKSHKMHDVFTSMLPSPQLGDSVQIPLGLDAPVIGNGLALGLTNGIEGNYQVLGSSSNYYNEVFKGTPTSDGVSQIPVSPNSYNYDRNSGNFIGIPGVVGVSPDPSLSGLKVDLSTATGIDINDFRFLIKLQRYRERLMLGGHRYREIISQFFHVDQLDNRAYIPEFLGMTREMVDINTVIQTSSSDNTSPQGNLTAYGVIDHHKSGFVTSAVEHSYVMGLARFRHNPLYQQGTNKLWLHETALDIYNPMFNGLGEQPVLSEEIVTLGDNVTDEDGNVIDKKAVGFQEAWYEYRYYPSYITGQLRTGVPLSLDAYHLGQFYGTVTAESTTQSPVVLNQSFVESDIPMDRFLSVKSDDARGIVQFVMDFRFNYIHTRVMPVHNIPSGLYEGI